MVSELIVKYIWLIQTLSAAGERGLSIDEICSKYSRRFDQAYSRRTFNNHRAAVQEVFGIGIECNRSYNRYYIPYSEDAMDNDESVRWMISTFTVGSLLSMGKERLSGRVSLEAVPSGEKFLTPVMQAMEEGRELEIAYSKYKSESTDILHVQPFAVKEHQRRWYLIGFCRERAASQKTPNSDREAWRVYGMDRIKSLRETGSTFRLPKGFDVEELFSESYGIFFPRTGEKPVTIRFKVTENEARYLRDLPLHWSQEEEGTAEDGKRVFRIRVIPNEDLMMEFCSHAENLEILEPESIRDSIAERLRKASDNYES